MKAIDLHVLAKLNAATEIEFGITERNLDLSPIKFVLAHVKTRLGLSNTHHFLLFWCQEPRFCGVRWKPKPNHEGYDDREEAFDNIDPAA